jgi:hypothetical protein
MTPKYFVEQIRKLAARLTNVEARVPAGKIKVLFNPSDTIAAGTYALETVTVPGVVPGDAVAISYYTSAAEPLIASGAVPSANTVRVWIYNAHATNGVTMAGDWYVHVIK